MPRSVALMKSAVRNTRCEEALSRLLATLRAGDCTQVAIVRLLPNQIREQPGRSSAVTLTPRILPAARRGRMR